MKFRVLCDLLSDLEAIVTRDPPLLPKARVTLSRNHIIQWFKSHRIVIDDPSTDAVALLSSLLPEKRTDRVYNLQPPSLAKVISRCLLIGASRKPDLQRWKEPGGGDLGVCVERVLKGSEFPHQLGKEVTIDQVDAVLTQVARRSRFSGPNIKRENQGGCAVAVDRELASIYRRLQSREAKWFTRLILKDFSPVELPEGLVLKCFHCLLPSLLEYQDNFQAAINTLRGPDLKGINSITKPQEATTLKALIAKAIVPEIGVKFGRPRFLKAHGIRHAAQMAHGRRMSLERKYDGEYCQIHIDLQKPGYEIQIFSKSGKDSTIDRKAIHETIKQSLRIGSDNCVFSSQCILEGELLVWSDEKAKILDFHKIRKHVSRSGVFLGTEKDSQPHSWEHLMIVFYDVMLIDGDPIMNCSLVQRRQRLEQLVTPIPGRAGLATHEEINFSSRGAHWQLLQALATCFVQRWEGFVMKPSDEPYVKFHESSMNSYSSCWIKLKKDYILGVGDTAEFAIVGAGYHAATATKLLATHLPWTHFHIGCLQNKVKVLRGGEKPKFLVVDCLDYGMSKEVLEALCHKGRFRAEKTGSPRAEDAFECSIESGLSCTMDVVFTEPFVFEMKGFGFGKPPNRDYFVLRFPGLVKIHWDRSYRDALSFDELQQLAVEANNAPTGDLTADVAFWTEKLLKSERGTKRARASWEDTQEHDEDDDSASDLSLSFLGDPTDQENTFRAPPTIRMDTLEILRSEMGSVSNAVVSKPHSEQSKIKSVTSNVPILSLSPKISHNQFVEKQSYKRKRLLDYDHYTDITLPKRRQTKSLISNVSVHSRHSTSTRGSNDRVISPLKEVTNEAQRTRLWSPTKDTQIVKKTSLQKLNAIHKLPPGLEKRPFKKTPKPPQTSLTFQKPPAPETFPPDSSHLANFSTSPTISHPLSSSSEPQPQPPILSPSPYPNPPRPPDLQNCILILSPCISHMPYLLEDLLRPLHPTILPTPTPTPTLIPKNHNNTPPLPSFSHHHHHHHHNPIIALVESYRSAPTGRFLRSLLKTARQLGKETEIEIEVWDWRMVEERANAETVKAEKKKVEKVGKRGEVSRWYVGRLKVESRDGDGEGDDEGAGVGVMQWVTGEVSRVRVRVVKKKEEVVVVVRL